MRFGKFFVRVAHSHWRDYGLHVIDGRRYPLILTDVRPGVAVFGRGGVISVLGLMLWWTTDVSITEVLL